jgi:bifunctional enzyme CysN/CysC
MEVGIETALALTPDGVDKGCNPVLRLFTCGSVDDGKSTLIGRLMYDSKRLLQDQLATLEADSRRFGSTGGDIDFALLLDGLVSEREQGITIDVAYRSFETERRRFVVADTPGHEQYTRNMVTGASNADLAVLLVDVRRGITTQTRRHARIMSLLGVRHVLLAVNKVDLVDFDQRSFCEIDLAFADFAVPLGFATLKAIPLSARFGDNVVERSERTRWYNGPSLLEYLEQLTVDDGADRRAFRYPVQWVNRPDAFFRGYAGTIASGVVRTGETLVVARTGQSARVERIVTFDGDLQAASSGASVTLTFDHDIDISRGDVLSLADQRPEMSDQFAAHLLWMGDVDLLPGRPYLLKIGTRTVGAAVTDLKYRVDVNSSRSLASETLHLNDIAWCHLSLSEAIPFDAYDANRTTGAFILIDRLSNATVAAGMIRFGLRPASNIQWQALAVSKEARSRLKGQRPCVLWFTGLSGAGKSTVANLVERKLLLMGRHTYILDGDNVRHGLNRDLGFTHADRVENIRRVGETAKLLIDAGLIVLVSFISPFRADRRMARELVAKGEFIEIFVDAPLEVAEARDPKGLYRKARAGQIQHFTGIDSPYEAPINPDVHLDTVGTEPADLADRLIDLLRDRGYLSDS